MGELTSISDSEELNFLALKCRGGHHQRERSADEARTYYSQIVRAKMIKEPERDLQAVEVHARQDGWQKRLTLMRVAPLIKHMSGGDAPAN